MRERKCWAILNGISSSRPSADHWWETVKLISTSCGFRHCACVQDWPGKRSNRPERSILTCKEASKIILLNSILNSGIIYWATPSRGPATESLSHIRMPATYIEYIEWTNIDLVFGNKWIYSTASFSRGIRPNTTKCKNNFIQKRYTQSIPHSSMPARFVTLIGSWTSLSADSNSKILRSGQDYKRSN